VISVIVPAFNEEATIGECLEALLSQEGLTEPWEIIVVDDGSSDGTAAVVSRLATGAAAVRRGAEGATQPPKKLTNDLAGAVLGTL
jgi:cellulose synthase/poly-beta-1,6-N-acetylglucosamine synthase-like glycosyltransferase